MDFVFIHVDRNKEGGIVSEFDLDEIREKRQSWGIYRDRRPEMYKTILSY